MYIPSWLEAKIKSLVDTVRLDHPSAERGTIKIKVNKKLYSLYPRIAQRTLRSYTSAIVKGENYRTELIKPHYTNGQFQDTPLIPQSYSQRDEYVARMKNLIASKPVIKLANVQDVHIETANPAVLNLVLNLLEEWKPDWVPAMCDVVDNSLFSNYNHGRSVAQLGVRFIPHKDDKVLYPMYTEGHTAFAQLVFEQASLEWITSLQTIAPKAVIPCLLGNHEDWAFRFLTESVEVSGSVLGNFMSKLQATSALWVDGDKNRILPVTDNVVALHGWSIRGGNYGANANNYLRFYEGMSILAGHSHRPETVWSKPGFNYGGRNFANITGTLGVIRPGYTNHEHRGHVQSISLVEAASKGNLGHRVTDVPILYDWGRGVYYALLHNKRYEEAGDPPFEANPFAE